MCGGVNWVGGKSGRTVPRVGVEGSGDEEVDGVEAGESHAVALSQPAMLAMVQERAEPCRTPQSKELMQVPNGVLVCILTSDKDSAIHSV